MLPIKDDVPSRTFPAVTVLLIVVNVIVFIWEISRGRVGLTQVAQDYGFVPGYLTAHASGVEVPTGRVFFPLFSSIFLHGGWLHLIGNMWYLWIFGDNVEDRMGHFRYLVFYLVCGLASGLVQLFIYPSSPLTIVGASGAIAGVMGGYLLLYPFARVVTLFFFFFFVQIIEIPALFFLGFWFVFQFLSGSLSLAGEGGGVAWWAHIGGFVCGALLVFPLLKKQKRGTRYH